MLIIVGAGHGVLCLGILEMFSALTVVSGKVFSKELFSLKGSYENSLIACGLFSLIGQICLLLSLFVRNYFRVWTAILGLLFLWFGFYYLIHNFGVDEVAQVGLFSGIPFLFASGILAFRLYKNLSQILASHRTKI